MFQVVIIEGPVLVMNFDGVLSQFFRRTIRHGVLFPFRFVVWGQGGCARWKHCKNFQGCKTRGSAIAERPTRRSVLVEIVSWTNVVLGRSSTRTVLVRSLPSIPVWPCSFQKFIKMFNLYTYSWIPGKFMMSSQNVNSVLAITEDIDSTNITFNMLFLKTL